VSGISATSEFLWSLPPDGLRGNTTWPVKGWKIGGFLATKKVAKTSSIEIHYLSNYLKKKHLP